MTPLAKKVFELFGKPELAAEVERKQMEERPASAPAATREPTPDYRALYETMTGQIPENFYLIDNWVATTYPSIWQRIRDLDDELLDMEQRGVPEATYRVRLNEMVAACQKARRLKMSQAVKIWLQ